MKWLLSLFLLLTICITNAQTMRVRALNELINKQEPAWPNVQAWIKDAKNKVEVLPKDSLKADSALYALQVTTRSPMGAITYETGGILINNGWIRILGSGSEKLPRTISEWNKGKSYQEFGQQPTFLLVADDVLGGFYAINNGGISTEGIGKIFYFAPDALAWEAMEIGYGDFITFCLSGDIDTYYKTMYWNNWQVEVEKTNGNEGIHCLPPLWTVEGKDLNKVSRKPVPIQELWDLYFHNK